MNGNNTKNHETDLKPFLHKTFKSHVQNIIYSISKRKITLILANAEISVL